jgi:hypothetical protein
MSVGKQPMAASLPCCCKKEKALSEQEEASRPSSVFPTRSPDFPYAEDEEEYQKEDNGDDNGNRYDDKDMQSIHEWPVPFTISMNFFQSPKL